MVFIVIYGEFARRSANSSILFHGVTTISILAITQIHLCYFYYREHRPRPLDPYIKEKLYVAALMLLILFWTYDLRNTNFLKLGGIILLGLINLFYFCRYIEGVNIEPKLDLDSYGRSPEFFSAYIKNLWYFIPKSLVLVSSIYMYLVYIEFLPPIQAFILLAILGLYAPIIILFLYRRSVSKYRPPKSDKIKDHIKNFYRYSELYPADEDVPIIEKYRQKIKSVGGDAAIKLIRGMQEKSLENPLSEWEQDYKSLAERLFYSYFRIAYLTPLVWLILDTLPLLYTITPEYDLGLYGLGVVLAGSLFLAAEPLSSIPGANRVQDARLAAYTHFGVLMLATGTIFQISSQLSNADVMSSFEQSNFLLYFNPEILSAVFTFVSTISPFIAIPLFVFTFLRSIEDERIAIDEQSQRQMTLDATYWKRKTEQKRKSVYVGPIGSLNERISVVVVSGGESIQQFAVNLEYREENTWNLVARFEHGINESNSIDTLRDGLQMFIYQNGTSTAIIDDFPKLELIDTHLYCESFLIRHAEELLSKYEKKNQKQTRRGTKSTQEMASLTIPHKNGEWITIKSTAHDLRERQTKIIAWGTDETIESIFQRINQYPMPDLSEY